MSQWKPPETGWQKEPNPKEVQARKKAELERHTIGFIEIVLTTHRLIGDVVPAVGDIIPISPDEENHLDSPVRMIPKLTMEQAKVWMAAGFAKPSNGPAKGVGLRLGKSVDQEERKNPGQVENALNPAAKAAERAVAKPQREARM